MVSIKLLFYLAIGTGAMLIPICVQSKWYGIKLWKAFVLAILLTVTGTIGTYFLFYIENGWIGGTSFFGAVFAVPVFFIPVAWLLRESFESIVDICAPAECVMLAIMKVQCQISGCCSGKVLYTAADGAAVNFPSQIVELVNALFIFCFLLYLANKKPKRGDIYPLYMLIYGSSRFVLNLFRDNQSDFFLGMAPGNVWSLLAVIIGAIWLTVYRERLKRKID